MARTSNNAPLTNQGRADLRRSPTGAQTDFNETGNSSVSVVQAVLLRLPGNFWVQPQFSTIVGSGRGVPRALCVFLWMTDRLTSLSAVQQYLDDVWPESTIGVPKLGSNLCSCAYAHPSNGMSALPVGMTCTLLAASEVGAQAVLAYGAGSTALRVRGTPVVVRLVNNEYYGPPGGSQNTSDPTVRINALSESILSGKPQAVFLYSVDGLFDPYQVFGVTARTQCIMFAADYVAGQYWLNGNQLVDGDVVYDIVGIYTEPFPT
jgi:hypothetical protein